MLTCSPDTGFVWFQATVGCLVMIRSGTRVAASSSDKRVWAYKAYDSRIHSLSRFRSSGCWLDKGMPCLCIKSFSSARKSASSRCPLKTTNSAIAPSPSPPDPNPQQSDMPKQWSEPIVKPSSIGSSCTWLGRRRRSSWVGDCSEMVSGIPSTRICERR